MVDAVDDAGGSIVAVTPKRESLEDYFTRMLERPSQGGGRRDRAPGRSSRRRRVRRRDPPPRRHTSSLFFGVVLALAIPSLPSYGLGVVAGVYREVALALDLRRVARARARAVPRTASRQRSSAAPSTTCSPSPCAAGSTSSARGSASSPSWRRVDRRPSPLIEQIVGLRALPRRRCGGSGRARWRSGWRWASSRRSPSPSRRSPGAVVVAVASLALLFIGHARDGALGRGPAGAR